MTQHTLDRRGFFAGLAAATASASAQASDYCSDLGPIPPPSGRSPVALGQMADVLWGTAIGDVALANPSYLATVEAERPAFLAMANALKFDHRLSRGPAPLDGNDGAGWAECDKIAALATRWNAAVRGDALAWNDWHPAWVKDLVKQRPPGWQTLLRDQFEGHIRAVFQHFDTLRRPDGRPLMRWAGVVNEPLNPWQARDGLAGWREGAWLDAFGYRPDGVPGYIHRAFEVAERYAPPGTALILNETFCEDDRFSGVVRPALLKLVDDLQRAGRTVSAVGLECHLMPQSMKDPGKPDWRSYVQFLRDLSKRGVDIYLTELDVNDCSRRDLRDRDALVAMYMRTFVTAALEVPAVRMISNWGISDDDSWWRENGIYRAMPGWAECVRDPECPRPTLYDAAMRPKPARDALAEALATRRLR